MMHAVQRRLHTLYQLRRGSLIWPNQGKAIPTIEAVASINVVSVTQGFPDLTKPGQSNPYNRSCGFN